MCVWLSVALLKCGVLAVIDLWPPPPERGGGGCKTDGAASIYIMCVCVRLYLWSRVWFLLSLGELNKVALKGIISVMPFSIPCMSVFVCMCFVVCLSFFAGVCTSIRV